MVPSTDFAVEYEGPVLADGSMPVAELAPALIALGEVFVAASRVAYPEREPVALKIRATDQGSFLVQLAIHSPDTWDKIVDLLSSPTVDALSNVKELVIGTGIGVVLLIKRVRNRRIEARAPLEAGRIQVTLSDGTIIDVPAEVLSLYDNLAVREKVRQVVAPVERSGVERVRFISDVTVEGRKDRSSGL